MTSLYKVSFDLRHVGKQIGVGMHASHVAATYRKTKKPSGGSSPRPSRSSTDSRKKQRKSCGGGGGWAPMGDDCWVRGGEVGGDMRSYDTAIVSGSLFARAISSSNLDIGIIIILSNCN